MIMTESTSENIYSSDQAHLLHHTFFDPADYQCDEVKATVLILHGMCEHSGRYVEFAQYLAGQGIAVATYDHLGHGKTAKNPSEFGFFAQEHPVQTVLKDVTIMANALKARHLRSDTLPHFIMGHSMGSFIVRNVLKHHGSEFAGAILMGTADKDPLIKGLIPIFAGLNKVASNKTSSWGSHTMNKLLNSKLGNAISASQFAWLAENTEAVGAYEADPLCGFQFTNNGYLTLFVLMNGGLNMDWSANLHRDFPLLVVSGQNDPIGNMGKGIHNLVARLQDKGFHNLSKILYPNMRHEPLHEMHKDIVYQDISQWITTKTSQVTTCK